MSHYADASLPQQLDAFVWFDESSAVTLLARSTRSRARPTRMALASTAVTNQSDLHGMVARIRARHPRSKSRF